MSAASIFPSKSSQVRIGVARTGSRVRSRFSPTIAYDARTDGMKIGRSRKRVENCFPTIACPISSSESPANSGGSGVAGRLTPLEILPTTKNVATANAVMSGGRISVAHSSARCSRSSSHSFSSTMSALFTCDRQRVADRRPRASAEGARRSESARLRRRARRPAPGCACPDRRAPA